MYESLEEDLKTVHPQITKDKIEDFKNLLESFCLSNTSELKDLSEDDLKLLPLMPARKLVKLWRSRGKLIKILYLKIGELSI